MYRSGVGIELGWLYFMQAAGDLCTAKGSGGFGVADPQVSSLCAIGRIEAE